MVASWRISEEKYPQKNQGTAGLEPATFSFNCHLQARLTSALLLPFYRVSTYRAVPIDFQVTIRFP
jgi:hypothetical protein